MLKLQINLCIVGNRQKTCTVEAPLPAYVNYHTDTTETCEKVYMITYYRRIVELSMNTVDC